MTLPLPEVEARFGVKPTAPVDPRFNAAPTQDMPIITNEEPNLLVLARWGLVPGWAKDLAIGNKMINARAETIEEKPSFKSLVKRRRCLVPTDGFYEWKAEGGKKQPYRITLKNGGLFAFAGLWDVWTGPSQDHAFMTYTIITTGANEQMHELHERMPLILTPETEKAWLNSKIDPVRLRDLVHHTPSMELKLTPVSMQLNNVRNDSAELINPL